MTEFPIKIAQIFSICPLGNRTKYVYYKSLGKRSFLSAKINVQVQSAESALKASIISIYTIYVGQSTLLHSKMPIVR